jgi:hypothetical protein
MVNRRGRPTAEKTHPKEAKNEAVCVHYWIIECPQGPTSVGTCRNCGERKVFRNFALYSPWEDDTAAVAEPSRSKKRSRSAKPDEMDVSES